MRSGEWVTPNGSGACIEALIVGLVLASVLAARSEVATVTVVLPGRVVEESALGVVGCTRDCDWCNEAGPRVQRCEIVGGGAIAGRGVGATGRRHCEHLTVAEGTGYQVDGVVRRVRRIEVA